MSRATVAAAVDTVIVLAFVVIGRRNHEEGEAIAGVLQTAAPFLISLATAWLILGVGGKITGTQFPDDRTGAMAGVAIWAMTVVFGLALRNLVFGDGTAASFMVVTTMFLGLLVVWRVVWRVVASGFANRSAANV